MAGINENISRKLNEYPASINEICKEIVQFAQTMPESAVKEHLDQLIKKSIKKGVENS